MILCNCAGVSEETYKKVLTNRKSCKKDTIKLVEDKVGSNCGSCIPRMKEIIKEVLNGSTESLQDADR